MWHAFVSPAEEMTGCMTCLRDFVTPAMHALAAWNEPMAPRHLLYHSLPPSLSPLSAICSPASMVSRHTLPIVPPF